MGIITQKLAAIDIGSNAVRVLFAHVHQSDGYGVSFQKNALVRVPIRLGADVFEEGYVRKENVKRLMKALKAFKLLMKVHQIEDYRACATSALREASNQQEIVEKVLVKTGISIEVISGKKEAALISRTQAFDFLDAEKNYLYVDVGGGSTELSFFENAERSLSQSFKIGTVRQLKQQKLDWEPMDRWIRQNKPSGAKIVLLGSGGNINKLFKLAQIKEGKPINTLKLQSLYQMLNQMTYEERIVKLDLNPDRADVILPAAEIYLRAMQASGAKQIFVPRFGLADGMIKEMYANRVSRVSSPESPTVS